MDAVAVADRLAEVLFAPELAAPVPGSVVVGEEAAWVDATWRSGLDFYLNCTRDVDRSIDVVLDALVASGQADRTVVIFTSDHGEMAGSQGLRQKGNLVYDENFHVPRYLTRPTRPTRVLNGTCSLGSAGAAT